MWDGKEHKAGEDDRDYLFKVHKINSLIEDINYVKGMCENDLNGLWVLKHLPINGGYDDQIYNEMLMINRIIATVNKNKPEKKKESKSNSGSSHKPTRRRRG